MTNTTATATDREAALKRAGEDLREAARLVRKARGCLNVRTHPCDHCGVPTYEARGELRAAKALAGTAEGLDRWAIKLENPDQLAGEDEQA